MYFMVGLPCVLPLPCDPGLKRGAFGTWPLKIRNPYPNSLSEMRSMEQAPSSAQAPQASQPSPE